MEGQSFYPASPIHGWKLNLTIYINHELNIGEVGLHQGQYTDNQLADDYVFSSIDPKIVELLGSMMTIIPTLILLILMMVQ